MSYFVGAMLILQRTHPASRHCNHSVWRVIQSIEFNSANDDNMNLLTKYTKCALIPASDIVGYTPAIKDITRQFDPVTSTALWQPHH